MVGLFIFGGFLIQLISVAEWTNATGPLPFDPGTLTLGQKGPGAYP